MPLSITTIHICNFKITYNKTEQNKKDDLSMGISNNIIF